MDPVLAGAHLHMGQIDNHARHLCLLGNRMMDDLDVVEADYQQLLDEFTDAKKQSWTPRWIFAETLVCLDHPLEFLATFLMAT